MIVAWRHLVNDIDLCRSPNSPFKVIIFGTNREPVYDFLLMINSILGPISHRY